MAYDEMLAHRIRSLIQEYPGFVEKKMFGGVGFMLRGNLACGVNKDNMIVRIGPDDYQQALAEEFTSEFDFTGKPMKGWIVVMQEGVQANKDLERWVQRGVEYALTLPPK